MSQHRMAVIRERVHKPLDFAWLDFAQSPGVEVRANPSLKRSATKCPSWPAIVDPDSPFLSQALEASPSTAFPFPQISPGCTIPHNFTALRRTPMVGYALLAIWLLIFITGIIIYIPIMYIRKTDRLLKLLQQIEANTRKS